MADDAAAGAAAAAIARAIKASGTIVRVGPRDFEAIVKRSQKPLVIHAQGGLFSTKHQYFVSYKGFAFYTKTAAPLVLPADAEVVEAEKVWTP